MSEYETSKAFVPQSDEVDAYPKVLKFVSVNWITCAIENPDDERKYGFVLAAAYCDLISEELETCKMIGFVSGMSFDCDRQAKEVQSFIRPRYF